MADDTQTGNVSSDGIPAGEQIIAALDRLPAPMVVALKQLMLSFGFPASGTVNEMPPGVAPALTAIADAFYGSTSGGRAGSPAGGTPAFPSTPPLPPPPPGVITG
ncbi:hypothetical protein [Streptomyces sp. NBC_01264]|uniref:hypothetical protein n=1 Tax=Streptomyces sp. NBC_01264 TaxID=2903804 RepID=UPI002256720B|nr:hypothetical protein [Streptomyces sp. NBC_01264]MCX4775389.1 hypothetical protein [Streptomyces sp. NBC_01264]